MEQYKSTTNELVGVKLPYICLYYIHLDYNFSLLSYYAITSVVTCSTYTGYAYASYEFSFGNLGNLGFQCFVVEQTQRNNCVLLSCLFCLHTYVFV